MYVREDTFQKMEWGDTKVSRNSEMLNHRKKNRNEETGFCANRLHLLARVFQATNRESVRKERYDCSYTLFPEAYPKSSDGTISFPMKISKIPLLSVTGRCPIQLIDILGRKMLGKVGDGLENLSAAAFQQSVCPITCVTRCWHREMEATFPPPVFLGLHFQTSGII